MFKQPVFRCFNCVATENRIISYINCGEPGSFENNSVANEEIKPFIFFNRPYSPSIWCNDAENRNFATVCNLVGQNMDMLIRDAIGPSLDKKDYFMIRKHLCEFFLACRTLYTSPAQELNVIKKETRKIIKEMLGKIPMLTDFPTYILLSSWEQPNIIRTSAYNAIHFTLDIYWLTISLAHQLEDNALIKQQIFERNIAYILEHLIHCSLEKYWKMSNYVNLFNTNIYLCSCYKELWLLIQLYLEEVADGIRCQDFWHYFNKSLMHEMGPLSGKDAVACLWVVVNVAQLQGFDSNWSYIGPFHHRVVSNNDIILQCFKHITSAAEVHDQMMCCSLQFLVMLQCTWWKEVVNFDIINLLWRYFIKRLNKYGTNVTNNEGYMAVNFYDYSVLAENILQYDFKCPPGPLCSFDIFLKLLYNYFEQFPKHWPKLKGRIYAHLSGPKMAELTDTGLHNLIKMSCVLARTVNFSEVIKKVHSLLYLLRASRSGRSSIIWSAYLSLMVMKCNREMPPTGTDRFEISSSLMFLVESANWDRKQDIMRIFLEGLNKIVSTDSSLTCYHLFSGWINRYLQWCPQTDLCYLVKLLRSILLRIDETSTEWWNIMESNVVPYIVQASNDSDTSPEVAELAALLVSADGTRFKQLLEHMTGNTVDVNFCCKFLQFFLPHDKRVDLNSGHEILLKQAWVRISVLTTDKSVLSDITARMKCLPNWFPMESDSQSPPELDDPLYNVILSAGLKLRDSKSAEEINAMKNWFEVYFGKMDLWVTPKKNHTDMLLTLRIYTAAAILYLHCAPALYTKSNSTCIFYRLTAVLLLSESVISNDFIIIAMRNAWHLFVRGIGRLDYKADIYIEGVLRDMVVKYIPHMYDYNSPITRCLDTEFENSLSSFVLDKISNILINCKSRHSHEHCLPALKLILEMSRKECDDDKSEILMRTVIPSLFQQLMFSEDTAVKNIVFQIISTINNKNTSDVKSVFKTSIMNIIDKHLAFNSGNVFRLLELLANISRNDVENIIPYLSEAGTKVEHMRGVNFDNSLRSGLLRIEEIVKQQ